MQRDTSRRRFPLADRVIEVIDDTLTGEVLLDEALKMMKSSEKMSVSSWIDLMSGKCSSLLVPTKTYKAHLYNDKQTANHPLFHLYRRNLEPDENRLPVKTSPRAPRQGPRRQRHPAHRKAQLPPLRHGHAPSRRRRRQRRDPPPRAQHLLLAHRRPGPDPVPA